MDARQLNRKLGKDIPLKENVWGVFARDELPATMLPGGYIVNTRDRASGGEHWIALYVTQSKQIEFVDSLGKKPEHYGIILSKAYIYNNKKFQASGSTTCGLFALYYLYWRTRGLPMYNILESFVSDTHSNEIIVEQFNTTFL